MSESNNHEHRNELTLQMTTDIVAAYLSNNPVQANSIPDLISSVHSTLGKLVRPDGSRGASNASPAVPIKKSITPDYLICLEDGKQLKMLKRYLRSRFGMSPEDYRAKWNLPADYPMVAPNYAERRSQFAKEIGLGKKSRKKIRTAKSRLSITCP